MEKRKLKDTNYAGRFMELSEADQNAVVTDFNNRFLGALEPKMDRKLFMRFLMNTDNTKSGKTPNDYKEILAQLLPKVDVQHHA